MKKKRVIIFILQLIVIIATAVMFMNMSKNTVKPTEVYVYERDILNTDEPISESDIRLTSIPNAAITSDFATSKEEIVGMYVDGKVRTGQYVFKSSLIPAEEVDPFSQMDLSKHRKISLPINFVEGLSGNIKRGDKIDLVYTGEGKVAATGGMGQEEFKYAKVFLQDVLVFNVNTDDGFRFKDYSDYMPNNVGSDVNVSEMSIITLAVTLEQAEEINARVAAGRIGFLGRFEDSKSYNTLGYVLGDYSKIHSGKGSVETGNIIIEEDNFEIID